MQIFSQLNSQIEIFLISYFALILGSFSTLVSHRLVTKEPIAITRSKCLNCGIKLKAINLIPLFSWLIQKGKCNNCHKKISIRYPLIELGFLISFLVVYFAFKRPIDSKMLIYFAITSVLLIMIIVDLEHYFIPDIMQYFFAILVTILLINEGGSDAVLGNIKSAFLYAGFGIGLWLLFYFAAGIEAIGIDDIKFFFTAGLLLGVNNFLTFMLISGLSGTFFGIIWQQIKKDDTFPFAPAICFSAFICMLFGQKINLPNLIDSLVF